ncbi:MAG: histidine triad nucleotide-binding protein [Candidatus Moranbacteria bacterium]|nr:histidine triad nucleotide-binding protein [Candidatus Moranbacteria bacterium]
MAKNDCVFCKIIAGEIKNKFLYESDKVAAFRDVRPIAPVHVLIIPKEHIESMNDLAENHKELVGEMLLAAVKIAKDLNIASGGHKLLIRTGRHGGQEISHIHLHLLGGAKLSEGIHPIE